MGEIWEKYGRTEGEGAKFLVNGACFFYYFKKKMYLCKLKMEAIFG